MTKKKTFAFTNWILHFFIKNTYKDYTIDFSKDKTNVNS